MANISSELSVDDRRRPRRFCYANVSHDEALEYGDCYFCGEPLSSHQPIRLEKVKNVERVDEQTGSVAIEKIATVHYSAVIDKHHITFSCLEDQLGEEYPPDEQNVVWVGWGCHVKFHADVNRRNKANEKWSLSLYKQRLRPIRYGELYLAS